MDFDALAHVFPNTAQVNDQGRLELGGVDTKVLAERFGTPLYVFCQETLRERCQTFQATFRNLHPETEVVYAAKAYIGPALAQILCEEGLGVDVVSGGELAVAQLVEFPGPRIYFHGNNKSQKELELALDYGVGQIVVDNLDELALLEKLVRSRGEPQRILLRVTPGVDPHTHAYTTTGILDSKFGLAMATGQAEEAIRRAIASPHLELQGLHFHLGSPIFELEPYSVAIDLVLAFAARFAQEGFQLNELNVGGGFAIAYTRSQHPPTVAEYAQAIVSSLREGCQTQGLPLPRLVVEPGRSIIGPAGVALYAVGTVKEIPGVRTYVSVDGGMGDNIRPALYNAQYEAVAASHMNGDLSQRVTIAGKYCESGDILAHDVDLPDLMPGDLLAMPAAGAYAPAMASNYNMNSRPAMVLVREGQAQVIRLREEPVDLLRSEIWHGKQVH